MAEITKSDRVITYDDSTAARAQLWQKLLDWCIDNNCTMGEEIWQCDNCTERAPEILTELTEQVFKFQTKYTDV